MCISFTAGGGGTWTPLIVVARDTLLRRSWELPEAECHLALLCTQQWPSAHSFLADFVNLSFNFPPSRIMPQAGVLFPAPEQTDVVTIRALFL